MKARNISFAVALCITWSVSVKAQVLDVPPAGTFQMRPELSGKHPRLYFTAADISEIRSQGLGPRKWFLDRAKSSFGSYKGKPAELRHDWKDYLYGFWAQFFMDLAYIVEQDQGWADTAKSWALFFARNQNEWLADDLVPMEIVSGMALTYDILYDQFSEAERAELRQALFAAAEFMYPEFFVGEYWTQDMRNNHMHNRIHGLAHAAFAIYGDDPARDVQKHADLAVHAFRQVARWLPEDGSTHEGPGYWSYGWHWVVRTGHLMEHVTGSDPLAGVAGFSFIPDYRIYLTAPGWRRTFGIGDSGDGLPDNPECLARVIAKTRNQQQAAVLREWMRSVPDAFYQHTAWGLLWYDGEMADRPYSELPLWHFWPDLEMFSVRSSWEADATALVFKCGPPGGHKMQQLSADRWFNVAHDHPDQNHFLLFAHGKMLAEDDGYPKDKKLTRSHNTLLFDGQGGPREDTGWYQPFPYNQTATMDNVFLSHSSAFVTGNATRLYAAVSPAAARVARNLAFVEGEYLIIVDELASNDDADHDFEWRLHKEGAWSSLGLTRFYVADGDVGLDINFLAPEAASLFSTFLPAELTAPPCLSVKARGKQANFVSVLVPQKNGSPQIEAQLVGATDAVGVQASLGTRVDLLGVSQTVGTFAAAGIEASAAAALVRSDAGEVRLAMLVAGTSLRRSGATLLQSDARTNLAWRPDEEGGTLEAEAAYKTTCASANVAVGGLSPGRRYRVSIDSQPDIEVSANGEGVASVVLDLSARRTAVFRDAGVVVEDGSDGGYDAGQDAGLEDGGHDAGDRGAVEDGSDAGQDGDGSGRLSGSCACSTQAFSGSELTLLIGWLFAAARRKRNV